MAKKETGFFPGSITSIRPDNDAEWTESFKSLLVDLEEERFHSRLLKRCRRGKSARNALVQDLIELGLDTLKNQNESENSIRVDLDGLPPETIAFLSSPQGQIMVRNLLLTFTTGMGGGTLPSPALQTTLHNEASTYDRKTIQQAPRDMEPVQAPNDAIKKTPMIIDDEFESAVDTEFEKELMEMEGTHHQIASTSEEIGELSVEKKSKFEKWKKRGDIGRS